MKPSLELVPMALAPFVREDDNRPMSDTVLLALITALSAFGVAAIGAFDRHQLHRQGIDQDELVAAELSTSAARRLAPSQ